MNTQVCDISIYHEWYKSSYPYQDQLSQSFLRDIVKATRADVDIWKSMGFDDEGKNTNNRIDFLSGRRTITNGQVLEISGIMCRQKLIDVQRRLSGFHGPVPDQDIYDSMCEDVCLTNDNLRQVAMAYSGCTCIELSTLPDSEYFKAEGDWCKESSGQMLCDEIGGLWCGEWECRMEDFHCRRIEYNTVDIPLKGLGGSCNGGTRMRMVLGFCSTCTSRRMTIRIVGSLVVYVIFLLALLF